MKVIPLAIIFVISLAYASFAQRAACDYKVEILINNSEFETKDFSWRMRATAIFGKSTNITGTAEIEDSKGQIVRKYKPWTNESVSKQKTSNTYSPNLKEGQYKIISRIDVECDDINKDNNADIKIIKINAENKEMTNAVNQSNIQNNFVEYKMNNSIKNETTSPVVINQAVENKTVLENESEKLIANEEDNVIQLKSANNKKVEVKSTTDAVKKTGIVYESSNEKAKNLIIVFILALSVLLNIVLIWRR